jgi:hypothetical protein
MNFRQAAWIFIFLIIAIGGYAQKHRLTFEHLSSIEGLSQSNVLCILQDSRGYYVVRYAGWDSTNTTGIEVKVYRKRSIESQLTQQRLYQSYLRR